MNSNPPRRSALSDFSASGPPTAPTVTVAIPVYNEGATIGAVLAAMVAQDYPQLTAIYVIDGYSTDQTQQVVCQAQQTDARIQLIFNPRRRQAAALNLAFAQATTDIVMRLDAHATYAPDVVRQSVAALLRTGAGGVGAIARPQPATTLVGQSIVAAHASKLGVGAAQFRQATATGWVDTVWNGCYWRHVVDAVGPFREDLPRTEDNDFHARLTALGYGLYLEPAILAHYQPRQTVGALWRQYWQNGLGIAQTLLTHHQAVRLRHLLPALLVASLLGLGVLSLLWRPAVFLLVAFLLLYALAVGLFTLAAWHKQPGRHLLLLPVIFGTLHLSYGIGTLSGLGYHLLRVSLRKSLLMREEISPVHPKPSLRQRF